MPQHSQGLDLTGLPANFLDDDDEAPEILLPLQDDPDLTKYVESVIDSGDPHDGLAARIGEDDEEDLAIQIQDWRTLSPDDPKGDMIQARVTPNIVRKMDHLISRTRGEVWSTRSDFMREAVWAYIRALLQSMQTQDPVLTTLLTEAELSGRATFHSARRARLEKAAQDMSNYLTDLVNLDDHEEAHRVLMDTALRLRNMRIVAWRRQWLLTLNAIPILKITVRLLDMNGWDIPVEFYPAAGRSVGPSLTLMTGGVTGVPAPGTPVPGVPI